MENDGPKTPGGEEEAEPAANVVHFPRDWFGPREELVPFGPRAAGEVADEPSLSVPSPVRADDFWGEESASIHNAMAGPGTDPVEVVEPVAAPAARRRRVRTRLASRLRVGLPRVRLPRPHVRVSWPRVRRPPVVIAAAVASACLLALSIIGSSWSGPVSVAHDGRDGATLSPAVIAPAVPPITSARTEGRAASRRRAATHGRASLPARARARAAHARVSGSAGAARSVSQAAVASSPSVGSSTHSDQSSGTVGESSATSAASATTSSDSSGGGGGGGGGGQSSGPVGPGAPFGPGHLG